MVMKPKLKSLIKLSKTLCTSSTQRANSLPSRKNHPRYQVLFFSNTNHPSFNNTVLITCITTSLCIHFSLILHILKRMSSAGIFTAQSTVVSGCGHFGLKPSLTPLSDSIGWKPNTTVSRGQRISCMKTWNPIDNKKFETLSYLPPLSDDSIGREIDYMISKGWVPCLEFDEVGYVKRENSQMPGYYDGRYWTLWKLPMFGCSDASQVLNEIQECNKTFPNAYIRCLAFDNVHQAQTMAFIVHNPLTTTTP